MTTKTAQLMNTQIQKEFESAYIYLNFASYFDAVGLDGFSHWYKVQAREEEEHAMKIFDYLHEVCQTVQLLPINAPGQKLESVSQILEAGLKHEEYVTSLINDIYADAEKAHDYGTMNFLSWFINEQREEEVNAHTLIDNYSLFAKTPEGLYALNKELGER